MKNLITKIGGKWKAVALLGVLTATPVLTQTETAEAQPRWDRRDDNRRTDSRREDRRDDRRDGRRDGRWDNRRNDNRRNDWERRNRGRQTTLTGRVASDLRGDTFTLRAPGRDIRVVARSGEPRRLSRGDSVRVTGRYQNGTFYATTLTILRNR